MAHFTSRKSLIRKAFAEHAIFQRDNSILSLSTALAAHQEFHRSKQSEILDLLMQLALHVMYAMPLNLTKRLPAILTQGIGPSWIKARVKSRSTGRIHR